jgi:hypothetical protein
MACAFESSAQRERCLLQKYMNLKFELTVKLKINYNLYGFYLTLSIRNEYKNKIRNSVLVQGNLHGLFPDITQESVYGDLRKSFVTSSQDILRQGDSNWVSLNMHGRTVYKIKRK